MKLVSKFLFFLILWLLIKEQERNFWHNHDFLIIVENLVFWKYISLQQFLEGYSVKSLFFILSTNFRNFISMVFVYRNMWIPFSHTSIYCYDYLNTVYIHWFRKLESFDCRSPPASRISFLFCTLRTIDVFTDAGIRLRGLHFINLDGILSLL